MAEGKKWEGRKHNAGQQQRNLAEDRRCPTCDRGAALGQWHDDGIISWRICRYCGRAVVVKHPIPP